MDVRIEITYHTPKGLEAVFSSEEMKAGKALVVAEDFEKTGRVKHLEFIDSLDHNTWNVKELKEYMKGIQTEPHNIKVYFDAGYDLKTRKSGLGCVIYYDQNDKSFRLRRNALVDQLNSNNEAEYAALHLALTELELMNVHHIPVEFVGDSQVVLNQLEGDWPTLEEDLNAWADRIENKMEQMGLRPTYTVISRKKNREADRLASQALNKVEITSTIEIND
ncbi:reverse transcriptase-like protein [Halobacillus sp. Marseille-Q1614]|uniref:reverse transcriptase-like protein n=1 Tax=Halobacillus sp. Marseille-Q1614 TaxID=2709134 RepID=UPI00156FC141|nr:reverse transcriptase-like protein [Halobacillus sp. Marseille-Q1614]